MADILRHRGPDDDGFFIEGPAGLTHTRLSIIDLKTGQQPVYNEDHTSCIVYNGEVFNYPELRRDLIDKGHCFYTQSDTEVVLHLYEEYGTDCFSLMNGQFALAIWDKRKNELVLARDRVGIRPLFYHLHGKRLVFASEIKALFADDTVKREINTETLTDIFTCWCPMGASTVFADIKQFLPGHFAVFNEKGLTEKTYWQLPFGTKKPRKDSFETLVEEFTELIIDATRIRLRADVPVGAYLSGGIDSTFTSSMVKHKFDNRLTTFSVGFSDARFDESAFQKIAVESLKTDHHAIQCMDSDIGAHFPRAIWHAETPLLRTAPVPLLLLSKLVRARGFKVVLTGEGADEVFAGYNIFKEDKIRRFWAKYPESRLRPILLGRLYPYIFDNSGAGISPFQRKVFGSRLTDTDYPFYSHHVRWSNTSRMHLFFSDRIKQSENRFEERLETLLPDDFMQKDPLARAQYLESSLFLSNYLLSSQGDRMTMGHSIEGRYPFLDYRVIEFAAQLPSSAKMNGLTEKYILKESARQFIPEVLIDRPKQPYRAPISRCFFGEKKLEYVHDLLNETTLNQAGLFDSGRVQKLIAKIDGKSGALSSERENMVLVGILSAQLIDHLFIRKGDLPS